ncbi:hypothetical protein G4B88_018883 [Cannabis sativa]|uniref:Uncharacterized protein n=1 Tax=Cannabis sativa TaxID=3483 RepID=A0A7J6E2B1_CANSA|nr:hypothetical protein G4B88_018883 [Cannabis sativa]
MDQLEGEVMACAYEDVQVMWSILDKSNSNSNPTLTSRAFPLSFSFPPTTLSYADMFTAR